MSSDGVFSTVLARLCRSPKRKALQGQDFAASACACSWATLPKPPFLHPEPINQCLLLLAQHQAGLPSWQSPLAAGLPSVSTAAASSFPGALTSSSCCQRANQALVASGW